MKYGIATIAEQRARTLAIASGKRHRTDDDPKVWFPSMAAAMRVLSDENMALLKVIREQNPASMGDVAKATGKQESNVSRSLHLMSEFGLVSLKKIGRTVVPEAAADHVTLEIF